MSSGRLEGVHASGDGHRPRLWHAPAMRANPHVRGSQMDDETPFDVDEYWGTPSGILVSGESAASSVALLTEVFTEVLAEYGDRQSLPPLMGYRADDDRPDDAPKDAAPEG